MFIQLYRRRDGHRKPPGFRAAPRNRQGSRRPMKALKDTSNLLQEWRVDAPEPTPEFVSQLKRSFGEEKKSFTQFFREPFAQFPQIRWALQIGLFLFGLVTGIIASPYFQSPATKHHTDFNHNIGAANRPGQYREYYHRAQ